MDLLRCPLLSEEGKILVQCRVGLLARQKGNSIYIYIVEVNGKVAERDVRGKFPRPCNDSK